MGSLDLDRLEHQAKARYERARLVRSVLGFAPVLAVIAAAALIGKRPSSAMVFGAATFATGVVLLWRGNQLQRAVLPGLLAGAVPLGLALAANLTHGCDMGHCSTYCLQACTAGGVTAGLAVSTYAVLRRHRWPFWAGASAMSLLTGAMGCACIGYSGVFGLLAGFCVGLVPQILRRALARA